MKFSMGITLFQPQQNAFSYLKQVRDIFPSVYVYDNSYSNKQYKKQITNLADRYNYNGENRGLSKAFNWFLECAKEDGADYLLLLDQDSSFDPLKLKELMTEIESIGMDNEVAIRACKAQPVGYKDVILPTETTNEEDMVISSGSFINMHIVKKYGLKYDERLFVDHVDFDFCNEIKQLGLKILCHNRFVMPQELGYQYKGRICHSPIRHYYMVRDIGYLNSKNYSRSKTAMKSLVYFIKDMFISMREDKTFQKIKYASYGYRDYLNKISGEYKGRLNEN